MQTWSTYKFLFSFDIYILLSYQKNIKKGTMIVFFSILPTHSHNSFVYITLKCAMIRLYKNKKRGLLWKNYYLCNSSFFWLPHYSLAAGKHQTMKVKQILRLLLLQKRQFLPKIYWSFHKHRSNFHYRFKRPYCYGNGKINDRHRICVCTGLHF